MFIWRKDIKYRANMCNCDFYTFHKKYKSTKFAEAISNFRLLFLFLIQNLCWWSIMTSKRFIWVRGKIPTYRPIFFLTFYSKNNFFFYFALRQQIPQALLLLSLGHVGETNDWSFEPSHEIMVLFVLRKPILQTRMRSHPVGLDVWCFIGPFVYFHTSFVRTAKLWENAKAM